MRPDLFVLKNHLGCGWLWIIGGKERNKEAREKAILARKNGSLDEGGSAGHGVAGFGLHGEGYFNRTC